VSFDVARLDGQILRIRNLEQKAIRSATVPDLLSECEREGLSWPRRAARLVRRMCESERPYIHVDEQIVFTRTVPSIPPIYTSEQLQVKTAGPTLHELGPISNICADWGSVLSDGLLERKRVALETRHRLADEPEAVEFLDCAIETIDAVLDLAARYADEARRMGKSHVAKILERVPALPPRDFHEALQSLRLLHAVVWMGGHYHTGLGRIDQYLWPYLKKDLDSHRLDIAAGEEFLAEFFISLNKDSDLYPGVQQGDNGQTIMLGGHTRDGNDAVNELTHMAIRVALYTNMIDPKVNLQITGNTDLSLLTLATELTQRGLGFPKYSNDAVVIPALVAHGYDPEDAWNYTVAACWEFIIPGKGMKVVNICAVSMPLTADQAIRAGLIAHETFDGILKRTAQHIKEQVRDIVKSYSTLLLPPAPYYSVLMDGCLETGRDLSSGLKYNNFGIHGAASSSAADALDAVQKLIFIDQSVQPEELLKAKSANFEGYEALQERLLHEAPKTGNDPEADALLVTLFDALADACEATDDNGRGGRVRPGTGSAMYYVWLTRGKPGDSGDAPIGATADGRREGEFFSANLAPSPQAQVRGPISVLQAFSHLNYRRIFNGGPITMELSDSVFADPEGMTKCAMLVQTFAKLGCQQLQLNTVNPGTLLDAMEHPERHRNLIVRVWGGVATFASWRRSIRSISSGSTFMGADQG
jgi:formate C-acetyltransferase